MIGAETEESDLELDEGADGEIPCDPEDLSMEEAVGFVIDYELEPMVLPDGSITIYSGALSGIISDSLSPSFIEDSIRDAMTLSVMPLPSLREDGIDGLKAWHTTLSRLLAIVDGALAVAGEEDDTVRGSA